MAIGRISGALLFSDLDRQGSDLAFTTNGRPLTYLDFTDFRFGVNTNSLVDTFTVNGTANISGITRSYGNLVAASGLNAVDKSTGALVVVGGAGVSGNLYAGNIFADNLNSNGAISTSTAIFDNLAVLNSGYFGSLNTANAVVTGGYVNNLSNLTATTAQTTNLSTGNAVISGGYISALSNATITTANIGNLQFDNITISSTTGNIVISPLLSDLNALTIIDGASALQLPAGNTAQQPTTAYAGALRWNTGVSSLEVYSGTSWIPLLSEINNQVITPDGTSINYTLDFSATAEGIIVSINGTLQQPGTAYTVSGTTITFAEVPLATDIISIRFIAAGITENNVEFGNVAASIIPSANITFDLGSSSRRWRDLWLSGNTINLGSAVISSVGNTVQLPAGSTVGGANVDVTAINANVTAANVRIAELNANIIATNAAIITANTEMKTYVDFGLADALFVAGSYGNVVVAEYLYFDPLISSIRANLGSYQTYANANVVAIQANLGSYQTYANANVVAIQANLGAYQLFANANVAEIQANLGAYQTYSNTNFSTQADVNSYQTYANANVVAIQANIGSYQTYANTKIGTNTDSNLVVVSNADSTSATTGALVVAGGVGINGNINLNGAGLTGNVIDLNNGSIGGINSLYFNDPGVNEGITWIGGNGWFIYESPNSLTNAAGNLQIVRNGIRTLTIDTNGVVTVTNTATSTSDTTGALVVAGGAGFGEHVNVAGNISAGNVALTGNLNLTANGIPTITFFRSPDTTVTSGEIYGNVDFVGEDSSTNAAGTRARISARSTSGLGSSEILIYAAASSTANAVPRLQVNSGGIRSSTIWTDRITGLVYYNPASATGGGITPVSNASATLSATGSVLYTSNDSFYEFKVWNTFAMTYDVGTANVSLGQSNDKVGAPILYPYGTNATNELEIWVTGTYVANVQISPPVTSRLRKRLIATVAYSEVTGLWSILDQQLCETVYNSDATNFAAGAVNAGKVFLTTNTTPGNEDLILRFDNRTSAVVNSFTRWSYTITSRGNFTTF
jgi:hypothetical protein